MSGPANLDGCRMRETAHINGGPTWFGYRYQVVEHPRISRMDRYTRADRSVTSTWRCDGVDCASLQDALARLATPPVITDDERPVLAVITASPMSKSEVTAALGLEKLPYALLSSLADKGLIWWDEGRLSLTQGAAS